uniref:Uncharacterized protein n=1 Tax=Amphora coffeiformis TaxID=265554 RepID=A0A7S3P074_9STRA|mmetsp:Transcript_10964/g.20868  ORF Transcript_10964/g.20868 Transcript_10964/m.20868 type:complete len:144 (-) Transcript_10964:79-510(-)|eukprot:scaffold1150_cov152-Amphora_coffeaeformis.AAC.1
MVKMKNREEYTVQNNEENAFEWQVDPIDPKLFLTDRDPELPFEMYRMPTQGRISGRRLRTVNHKLAAEAQEAGDHVQGNGFELCVDDVKIMGDIAWRVFGKTFKRQYSQKADEPTIPTVPYNAFSRERCDGSTYDRFGQRARL